MSKMTENSSSSTNEENRNLVDHPPHYREGGIEAIDVITAWKLDFELGNVVKYIARFRKKRNPLQDLRKAQWYLQHRISRLERESTTGSIRLSSKRESVSSSKE